MCPVASNIRCCDGNDVTPLGRLPEPPERLRPSVCPFVRAQIERFEGFAWNDFWVCDDDAIAGDVSQRRIDEVAARIGQLLNDLSMPLPPPTTSLGGHSPQ